MPPDDPSIAPILAVRGLRTFYHADGGFVRAVDGVSFEVARRARVGLAGASGSGKTQTALSVLGLLDGAPGIVGGGIWIDGENMLRDLKDYCSWGTHAGRPAVEKAIHRWRAVYERRLRPIRGTTISMVFQEPKTALVPYQTVAAHLAETHAARFPAGTPLDAEALLQRLGFAAPGRVLARYPHELSGGESQRVMLALALLGDPRLLLADEPTALLDALSRRRIADLLAAVLDERADLALLLISHDLALLRLLVEDVVVLFAGTVAEQGPAATVLDPTREDGHPYTQALLRAAPGAAPSGPANQEGCRYFHRCTLKDAFPEAFRHRCRHERPPDVPVAEHHTVACWAHEEAA